MSGHKGLTPTLTPSIVGTAEENAKVDIYVDNKLVASVDVDKDGNWSYEFKDNELSEGENSIKVVAVDKAGNKNETTDSIITDTIAPEKPTIELDDSSDSGIKNDNITNSTLPTFIGVAEPGSTVSIYLGLKHLGEVIVAKDGTWSYTLTTPLKDGEYNITATATDIAGIPQRRQICLLLLIHVSAISALRLKRLMIAVLSEITLLTILAQPLQVKLSQMLLSVS